MNSRPSLDFKPGPPIRQVPDAPSHSPNSRSVEATLTRDMKAQIEDHHKPKKVQQSVKYEASSLTKKIRKSLFGNIKPTNAQKGNHLEKGSAVKKARELRKTHVNSGNIDNGGDVRVKTTDMKTRTTSMKNKATTIKFKAESLKNKAASIERRATSLKNSIRQKLCTKAKTKVKKNFVSLDGNTSREAGEAGHEMSGGLGTDMVGGEYPRTSEDDMVRDISQYKRRRLKWQWGQRRRVRLMGTCESESSDDSTRYLGYAPANWWGCMI